MNSRLVLALIANLGIVMLSHGPIFGQVASLARDINTVPDGFSSPEVDLLAASTVNGHAILVIRDSQGDALWATDGSSESTWQLSADGRSGGLHGDRPYAQGDDVQFWSTDYGLLRTDGTRGGTRVIAETAWSGEQGLSIGSGTMVGESLFVLGEMSGQTHLFELTSQDEFLQVSNGVDIGSASVTSIHDGVVFATTSIAENRDQLWGWTRSDPTLQVIQEFNRAFAIGCIQPFRDGAIFIAQMGLRDQYWVSDGTPSGTVMLADVPFSNASGGSAFLSCGRVRVNGDLAFWFAEKALIGTELWVSDGSPQGTRVVTQLADPQPFSGPPSQLLAFLGDRILFRTSGNKEAIWATSLTSTQPATLLTEFSGPRPSASAEPLMVAAGGRAYFVRPGAGGGSFLWFTDGTPGGTGALDLPCPPASCLGNVELLEEIDGDLYLAGWDSSRRQQIWRIPHGALGVEQVTFLSTAQAFPFAGVVIAPAGELIVFTARVSSIGRELYSFDPVSKDVELVREIAPDRASSYADNFTPVGGRVVFGACRELVHELWRSDGSAEGTLRLRDLYDASGGCSLDPNPMRLASDGETAFLVAHDSSNNGRFFRTDGTAEGTVMLSGLPNAFNIQHIAARDGVALITLSGFSPQVWRADEDSHQGTLVTELANQIVYGVRVVGEKFFLFSAEEIFSDLIFKIWVSDGTAPGTRLLFESEPTFQFQDEPWMLAFGSGALFQSYEIPRSGRLWVTDGTLSGTREVQAAGTAEPVGTILNGATLGDEALLLVGDQFDGGALWVTDGTTAGTRMLVEFDRFPFSREEVPMETLGGFVYFVADDGVHGQELWRSDGTVIGTQMVLDMVPGLNQEGPQWLRAAGNYLYFSGFDPVYGRELWMSEGTSETTRLAHDLSPGRSSSDPAQLTVAGNRLFFSADDGLSGRELWSLPLDQGAACQPSERYLCLKEDRFRLDSSWRDFQGRSGEGKAVTLTPDTGYFWFFNPNNVELIAKVLDGNPINEHFWTFFGALSNVEYALTVTDTENGLTRRYYNPARRFASVGDTQSFGPNGAKQAVVETTGGDGEPRLAASYLDLSTLKAGCAPGPRRLCLNDGRFAVEAAWEDFQGKTGFGTAVELTEDTGYFWFFRDTNVEVVLKVLDGRVLNDHFWVFYGALSNVAYQLTVTDTETGEVRVYENPARRFGSVGDTEAFAAP